MRKIYKKTFVYFAEIQYIYNVVHPEFQKQFQYLENKL